MTTPVPAPSRPPATTAQTGDYVHAEWMADMAVVLAGHIVPVYQALRLMAQTLTAVKAGRTQLDLVNGCLASTLTIMRFAAKFVSDTDERFLTVFEAIQQAGGQDEVAQEKTYHDGQTT